MKHQWDMLTEENEALLREVYPNLMPESPEPTPTIILLTVPSLFRRL